MSFNLSRHSSSGYMRVGKEGATADMELEAEQMDAFTMDIPAEQPSPGVPWTKATSIKSGDDLDRHESGPGAMEPTTPPLSNKPPPLGLNLGGSSNKRTVDGGPPGIGLPPQAPDLDGPLYNPQYSPTVGAKTSMSGVSRFQYGGLGDGGMEEAPYFDRGAGDMFKPHEKVLEALPAWKNMKIRSMMQAARDQCIRDTLGGDLDVEKFRRWAAVSRTAYSERTEARVRALLRLGYPPAVLKGLNKMMDSIESAIADGDDEHKGDCFSEAVTTTSQLLGLKGETSELLLTTRASDGARVMGNAVRVGTEQIDAMMTGSCNKPVVTFEMLLEHLLIFSPVTCADDKVDLLIDMFSSGDKDAEYVSMDDTHRMLGWLRKEADYSAYANQDTVDVMYQRLLRDYKRALREDTWSPEAEDHPDEVLLAEMKRQGLHRFVLTQVLLSTERGGRVHFKPGHEVICQDVKNKEIRDQKGVVVKRDPRQRGYMIVRFPEPLGEKHLKRTSLRTAPGVEQEGDVSEEAWGMYANLCLNIRPKIETDPAEVPEFGIRLLLGWAKRYFVVLLFIMSVILLGGLVFFLRFIERTAIRNTFGGSLGVCITSGMYINWFFGLAMVAGCHNVLSRIPFRLQETYGGQTSRSYWHLALGVLVLLTTIAHIVASADVLKTMTDRSAAEINAVLGTSLGTAGEEKISKTEILKTYPVITGCIMFFLLLVIMFTTLLTQHSLLFKVGHFMYVPLLALFMVHGLEGWFEWEYLTIVFLAPFILVVFAEFALRYKASTTFIADEVHTVKSHRGNACGVEFRVRRPEGGKMARQQAGQYVEVKVPSIDGTWQPGAVLTAPEIEDETVRIQVTCSKVGNEWTKNADEMVLMSSESIKKICVKGPYGLKASEAIVPLDEGGAGRILLIGEYEGVHNVTAVMNDLNLSLTRPDDAVRRNVSKLHRYVESFAGRENAKLEIHIIAVVKALEGHRRFIEALLHLLKQESEISCEITVDIFVSQYASQGTGVECWKRMKKLGSERRHDGKRDEHHDLLIEESIQYGVPEWDQEFLNLRYRWLGKHVDVLHWGDRSAGDAAQRFCHQHSYDPSRTDLRTDDQTVFSFNRGAVAMIK